MAHAVGQPTAIVKLAQASLELNLQLATIAQAIMHNEEQSRRAAERRKAVFKRMRRKRFWVRPWLLRRPQMGQYERLMNELLIEDGTHYKNFVRMQPAMFQELLAKVGPRITKQDTFWRKAFGARTQDCHHPEVFGNWQQLQVIHHQQHHS